MKKTLLIFFFSVLAISAFAQDNTRILVKGEIIADIDDLENITIYNATSNKGVVTDSIGNFKIKVALNDEIKISSIQLKLYKTKITKEVIENKFLKVYLKQEINTLDEVVLLPYDLTGDLETDAANVKTVAPIDFSFASFDDFEMSQDHHSRVDNIAVGNQNDRQRFQANPLAIIALLTNAIFKNRNKKEKKEYKDPRLEIPISEIAQKFPPTYFIENYNIPEDKVEAFIGYLEDSNFDYTLLETKNQLQLIEYFHAKSKLFLELKNEKE